MVATAAIGLIGSALSGLLGSSGAKKAAQAQVEAARIAAEAELEMFYTAREDLNPLTEAMRWALGYPGAMLAPGQEETGVMPTPAQAPPARPSGWIPAAPFGSEIGSVLGGALVTGEKGLWKVNPELGLGMTTTGEIFRLPEARRIAELRTEAGFRNQNALLPFGRTGRAQPAVAGGQPGRWREGGLIEMIAKGPGQFEASPDYAFRVGEGIKALERGAAARGDLLSGAELKALMEYGQEMGSLEFDRWLDRYYRSLQPYFQLTGLGGTAAGESSRQAIQTGRDLGNIALYSGTARGSGYINQANALTGALNRITEGAMIYNALKQPGQGALPKPYSVTNPNWYAGWDIG